MRCDGRKEWWGPATVKRSEHCRVSRWWGLHWITENRSFTLPLPPLLQAPDIFPSSWSHRVVAFANAETTVPTTGEFAYRYFWQDLSQCGKAANTVKTILSTLNFSLFVYHCCLRHMRFLSIQQLIVTDRSNTYFIFTLISNTCCVVSPRRLVYTRWLTICTILLCSHECR